MYVQHTAWLNATLDYPDDMPGPKHSTRRDAFKHDEVVVTMPECAAMYLISYLFEIGPTLPNGMGDAPINHTELDAWQRNTGIELDAWEVRTMKRLSLEYLSVNGSARDLDAPAPWADAPYLTPAVNVTALRLQRDMIELADL